jgi:hypothetical protein
MVNSHLPLAHHRSGEGMHRQVGHLQDADADTAELEPLVRSCIPQDAARKDAGKVRGRKHRRTIQNTPYPHRQPSVVYAEMPSVICPATTR